MNLKYRLARLERTVVATPVAPCPECGAPPGWVPALSVQNDEGVEMGPTCSRCGFPLMSNGRAVTPLPPGSQQKVVRMNEPLPF